MAGQSPEMAAIYAKAKTEALQNGASPDEARSAARDAVWLERERNNERWESFRSAEKKRKQHSRFMVVGGIVLVCIVLAAILIW